MIAVKIKAAIAKTRLALSLIHEANAFIFIAFIASLMAVTAFFQIALY
jgi:hypothetical protein